MVGLDPNMVNLFLQALQGNSNVSSTLNNLDNPFLVYLAGQYLPPVGGAGGVGGQITSRYAGNPEYPAVNQLLAQIQQGDDEFQYGTAVKALIAQGQTDGLDSGEFERLAGKVYEESVGGGRPKETRFSKAGFADPIDVYTTENLPMRPGVSSFLQRMAAERERSLGEYERASSRSEAARKAVAPLYDREFTTEDLLRYLKEDPEGQRLAKDRGIDLSKVSKEGDVYTWRGTQRKRRSVFDPRNFTEAVSSDLFRFAEDLGRRVAGGQTKTLEGAVGGVGKIVEGQDAQKEAYRKAASKTKAIEDDIKLKDYQAEKWKKAYLGRLQERGITPLQDQLQGVMGLLAQNR